MIGGSSWLYPNSYLKHLHPRVDGILAVSKSVQAYLQKQIWWNPEKVKQFYKGQRLDWYKDSQPINRQELGIPPDAFIITCIANNRKWKGVNFLLEATQHLPPTLPFHFLLIGRKMDTTENLKLIRTSPYKNQIHILGHRKDICEILATSQVYVQPSLKDKEGLGKAILEAMSLGVPPIVTNSGGPKEYVKDGVSGMVIPPKDAKAIAHEILVLYEDEQLRKELGKSAKLVIEGPLNMETSISKVDQIFKNFPS